MIARTWRAQATRANAEAYRRHFETTVVPHLTQIPGHQGAWLLQRDVDGQVEFMAVTLWDSIKTVQQFAGADPDVANVEQVARDVLTEFDRFVTHYEVACRS